KLDSLKKVIPEGVNLFWVITPEAGTVIELDVFGSQEVTPEREKPLMRISDLDEVLVIADVQERDAWDIRVGDVVEIRSRQAGLVRKGIAERVSEVVDPVKRTVEVRIRAQNSDRALRPNAYVDAVFPFDPSLRRISVPVDAVVTDGEESVIFVA